MHGSARGKATQATASQGLGGREARIQDSSFQGFDKTTGGAWRDLVLGERERGQAPLTSTTSILSFVSVFRLKRQTSSLPLVPF